MLELCKYCQTINTKRWSVGKHFSNMKHNSTTLAQRLWTASCRKAISEYAQKTERRCLLCTRNQYSFVNWRVAFVKLCEMLSECTSAKYLNVLLCFLNNRTSSSSSGLVPFVLRRNCEKIEIIFSESYWGTFTRIILLYMCCLKMVFSNCHWFVVCVAFESKYI